MFKLIITLLLADIIKGRIKKMPSRIIKVILKKREKNVIIYNIDRESEIENTVDHGCESTGSTEENTMHSSLFVQDSCGKRCDNMNCQRETLTTRSGDTTGLRPPQFIYENYNDVIDKMKKIDEYMNTCLIKMIESDENDKDDIDNIKEIIHSISNRLVYIDELIKTTWKYKTSVTYDKFSEEYEIIM